MNIPDAWDDYGGNTPLHCVLERSDTSAQIALDMLALILEAPGANLNVRNDEGETPLCYAIGETPSELRVTFVTTLLRAGVSLDGCRRWPGRDEETAEDILQSLERGWTFRVPCDQVPAAEIEVWEASGRPPYFRGIVEGECIFSELSAEQEVHWAVIKARVHGVRKHGSYKRYARSFHRDVLVVRGLAQRGKLSTPPPPSYPSPPSLPVLNFLARLGDNGVVWHILGYWRATD